MAKGPDTKSEAHRIMEPRLEKVAIAWGGTDAVRAARRLFLPQYTRESTSNYNTRVKRTVFFNYFKKTVQSLSGKPFSRKLKLEEADERIEELMDNIDLQGNSMHVFAQRMFIEALRKGISHCMVWHPENTATNAAEEQMLRLHPYWENIPAESLLAAYTGVVDGQVRCIYARYTGEELVRTSDWEETKVQWIYEHFPGAMKAWRKDNKQWVLSHIVETPLNYVPLLTFYAGEKEADYVATIPLGDLLDKNIEHCQSSSDQRNILTITRFPMLAGKGVEPLKAGEERPVGPNEIFFEESKDSEYYYIESKGNAVAAGRTDLEDLKAEMAILALEMLAPRSNRATATEKVIDAGESVSVLQMLAINFRDFLEQCLIVTGDWMGIDPEDCGEVKLNDQFDLSGLDAKALDALIAARNAGDITTETFLKELHYRKILQEEPEVPELLKIPNSGIPMIKTLSPAPLPREEE